jgi:hypothetical protein
MILKAEFGDRIKGPYLAYSSAPIESSASKWGYSCKGPGGDVYDRSIGAEKTAYVTIITAQLTEAGATRVIPDRGGAKILQH